MKYNKYIIKGQNGLKTKPSFEDWYKTVPEEKNDTAMYSLKEAYANEPYSLMQKFASNPKQHLYDTYKKPNHWTFSNQSNFSTPQTPGGRWSLNKDSIDMFTPSAQNYNSHGIQAFNNYMKTREPNVIINGLDATTGADRTVKRQQGGILKGQAGLVATPVDPYVKSWFSNPITTTKLNDQFGASKEAYFNKIGKERVTNIPNTLANIRTYPVGSNPPNALNNGQVSWDDDVSTANKKANYYGYSTISDSSLGILKTPESSVKLSTQLTGISNPLNWLNGKDKEWYPNIMDVRKKLNAVPGVPVQQKDLQKLQGDDSFKYLKEIHGTDEEVLKTLNTVAQNKNQQSQSLQYAKKGTLIKRK